MTTTKEKLGWVLFGLWAKGLLSDARYTQAVSVLTPGLDMRRLLRECHSELVWAVEHTRTRAPHRSRDLSRLAARVRQVAWGRE